MECDIKCGVDKVCEECGKEFNIMYLQAWLPKITSRGGKAMYFCNSLCKIHWEDKHPKKIGRKKNGTMD